MIDHNRNDIHCPKCQSKFYYRHDIGKTIYCAAFDCKHQWEGRREDDNKIPTLKELRDVWQK
jgi:hypothetical protein